jgi:site-specific recombinase XerD
VTRSAEPLTAEEVRALIKSSSTRGPSGIRNRALIAVLWRGGLRIGEALALYPRDLDRDAGTVRVRHGKGDKTRLVCIDAEALAHLDRWLDWRARLGVGARAPVFCTIATGTTRRAGEALDASYVRQLLPRLARRAGIDKRVHAHGLRHTHALDLVTAGATITDIRDQLGHANVATTDAYLRRVAPADRIKRLRALGWDLEPVA